LTSLGAQAAANPENQAQDQSKVGYECREKPRSVAEPPKLITSPATKVAPLTGVVITDVGALPTLTVINGARDVFSPSDTESDATYCPADW